MFGFSNFRHKDCVEVQTNKDLDSNKDRQRWIFQDHTSDRYFSIILVTKLRS